MCGPIAAGVGAGVAMMGLNVYMGEQQAKAENATARYNARLQEIEARKVENKGVFEENKFRADLHERISAQRAQLAGNLFSSKTPLRSEEHTSELQSRGHLVCRLL